VRHDRLGPSSFWALGAFDQVSCRWLLIYRFCFNFTTGVFSGLWQASVGQPSLALRPLELSATVRCGSVS
jgi:hypothetical protein